MAFVGCSLNPFSACTKDFNLCFSVIQGKSIIKDFSNVTQPLITASY